jgi:hypothetical protein
MLKLQVSILEVTGSDLVTFLSPSKQMPEEYKIEAASF